MTARRAGIDNDAIDALKRMRSLARAFEAERGEQSCTPRDVDGLRGDLDMLAPTRQAVNHLYG